MESNSAWRRIFARLRGSFKKWCLFFVAAMLLTVAAHVLFQSERAICYGVVHFNYAGSEAGDNPNGNQFDLSEMKSPEIVRRAAEAIGADATEENVERIRAAVEITGQISNDAFQNVTQNTSIFGDNKLSEITDIREGAYFPVYYTVKLHYTDIGFSAQDATQFLSEFLTAYESFFYEKYGYHDMFERFMDDVDYQAYDYVDAVDVLNNHLTTLRVYLTRIAEQDNTRFVSKETGCSFPDLLDILDTIRDENVQWVTSYIIGNNMTKDRDYLIDYYQYKIEDAERALEEQDARLYTLNNQIESYVKTTAVFPVAGENARGEETAVSGMFEFTQSSEMYNSLINQKVDCQTSISEIQEQISMFERRIERLQAEDSSGNPAIVEEELKTINEKIHGLLANLQRTSDEFYKSERLENAFQILQAPKTKALSVSLRNTAIDVIAVEVMLFGLYILSALLPSRKGEYAGENRAAKEQVST